MLAFYIDVAAPRVAKIGEIVSSIELIIPTKANPLYSWFYPT